MGNASLFHKTLDISMVTSELRRTWGLTQDEATLRVVNLRRNLHQQASHTSLMFNRYTSDFIHKNLSFAELLQHVTVLAYYAKPEAHQTLRQGSLVQQWAFSDGWHPVLNRMFYLLHQPFLPVAGPDICTLHQKHFRNPDTLLTQLVDMFGFYCKASCTPSGEGFTNIACAQPGDIAHLGRRYPGEIVFLYRQDKTANRFALTLVPHDKESTVNYRLGIQWHATSADMQNRYGLEEILAKTYGFGAYELNLTSPKNESQKLSA